MSCNICLTNKPINPIITPCTHLFCFKCIKEWMNHKINCPCCRRKFNINEVLEYYHKYSSEIVTRSKTIKLRRVNVLKNINIKLRNLKLSKDRKKKEKEGYCILKYVYINRAVFNSNVFGNILFFKTVLKKALQFYEKDRCKKFYEWVFKFRNYIKLLDIDFNLDDITLNIYQL